jgi:hypothetical protein
MKEFRNEEAEIAYQNSEFNRRYEFRQNKSTQRSRAWKNGGNSNGWNDRNRHMSTG